MNNKKVIEELKMVLSDEQILLDEPMKLHTTYKIGGPIDYFIKPNTDEKVAHAIKVANKYNIEYFLVGRGSNLLVSDSGYRGMVIYLGGEFADVKLNDDLIIDVKAGASIIQLSNFAYKNGLSGLEFACGIPGTVGGAVFMNAGAYGGEIKDSLIDIRIIDEDGNIVTMTKEELQMEYRKTVLMSRKCIILSARLQLTKGNTDEIKVKMDEYNSRRKASQPIDRPNAGSVFKRPEGQFPGKLIDEVGLKGFSIGGAQISEKHANFIINKGDATASDVMELIKIVQEKVLKESGVKLEMEIKTLGEF